MLPRNLATPTRSAEDRARRAETGHAPKGAVRQGVVSLIPAYRIPAEQIRAAIGAGIANIYINTDLRVAFAARLRQSIAKHPDEVVMYKLDAEAIAKMKEAVKEKLALFGAVGRI